MLYDLYNPTKATRIIYDGIPGSQKEIKLAPGERTQNPVALSLNVVAMLRARRVDLEVRRVADEESARTIVTEKFEEKFAVLTPKIKPPMIVIGMWGIGDNLHQRAVLRELMTTHTVWLETCHGELYHDLVKQGLQLIFRSTRLRAQSKTIAREKTLFDDFQLPPDHTPKIKLWYYKQGIDQYGSILQALFGAVGRKVERQDFSLPIKPEWRAKARTLIASWNIPSGKPLMIYRPIVQRREWDGASRNPDVQAYEALYKSVRDKFFVVSIADLESEKEWIVGPEQDADIKIHDGSLDFPMIAALWAEANIVFCNAGFAPVLAQSVGTPSIVVYGGRESFRTTQAAGAHLAPTLGIDPDKPCDCHTNKHNCDKRITLPPALEKVVAFADKYTVKQRAKTLIFATTFIDCKERAELTDQWLTLVKTKNPDCDILFVDAKSPFECSAFRGFSKYETGDHNKYMLNVFNENVGHLSRGGKDGWGRAFCFGLQAAIDGGYEYVVHIEGDSLFRKPVSETIDQMRENKWPCVSFPVVGMHRVMPNWVETGLMFFNVQYLKEKNVIGQYNWPVRQVSPTPEVVLRNIIGMDLCEAGIKGLRSDKQQITVQNLEQLDLDWITHCHNDIFVYRKFMALALGKDGDAIATMESASRTISDSATASIRSVVTTPAVKLNFGCGTNKLPGWRNTDIEVNIEKPLTDADNSADFIFAEHCVEHIDYYSAIRFFQESFRVLKPGGVIRIAVPSVEQIMRNDDPDYWQFTTKFHKMGATKRGAMHNILFCHGHRTGWTASLLEATLFYVGFENPCQRLPGASEHRELQGIEGHGSVITEKFNRIETLVYEGVKPGPNAVVNPSIEGVAIVVGGGKNVFAELEAARRPGATYFVINDMIQRFPGDCIAVSLHPDKLVNWLLERRKQNFPEPKQIWAHKRHELVTKVSDDWSGSSGLFSVKIARELGFERIILCGVPMMAEEEHFVRNQRWNACLAFRRGWERHKDEIAPYVRSMSGWTKEMFGAP